MGAPNGWAGALNGVSVTGGRYVGSARPRLRGRAGQLHQPGLAEVQPPHLGFGLEDQRIQYQQPGGIRRPVLGRRVTPGFGVLLQRPDGHGALGMDGGANVDAGKRQRQGELDSQFVPRRARPGTGDVNQLWTSARPSGVML